MRRSVIGVLFGLSLCGIAPVGATEPGIPHLRSLTDRGVTLLEVGRTLSPTVRDMLQRVEESDIILQIDLRTDFGVKNSAT